MFAILIYVLFGKKNFSDANTKPRLREIACNQRMHTKVDYNYSITSYIAKFRKKKAT
jgi:hypothetical protein